VPSLYQVLPNNALEIKLLEESLESIGVDGVDNFDITIASEFLMQPFVSILVT
jgi:hypothetical protein